MNKDCRTVNTMIVYSTIIFTHYSSYCTGRGTGTVLNTYVIHVQSIMGIQLSCHMRKRYGFLVVMIINDRNHFIFICIAIIIILYSHIEGGREITVRVSHIEGGREITVMFSLTDPVTAMNAIAGSSS